MGKQSLRKFYLRTFHTIASNKTRVSGLLSFHINEMVLDYEIYFVVALYSCKEQSNMITDLVSEFKLD